MTAAKKILDEKFVKSLVPLGEMDPERFNQLPAYYRVDEYSAGSTIFSAGNNDNRTYWLVSGQLSLEYIHGNVRTITANTTQARYALIPEQPRNASAIAKSPVTILSIDSELLEEFIHWNDRGNYQVSEIEIEDDGDWMTRFLQSKVFLKLPAQNIQALMMRLEEVHMEAGQTVIRQGDDDGNYYIIKKGTCSVTRKHSPQAEEIELAVLTVGAGFGEEAIITHNRRGASVRMLEDGCMMKLSRNDFDRLLVEPLIQIVNYADVADNPNIIFLDVRPYDEYISNGIKGSQNIILTQIRPNINDLDRNKIYVVCSNAGSRAAAAAFLLCQQGIEAIVLRYGLENVPEYVERGNQELEEADLIPTVSNVVSLPPVEMKQERPPEQANVLEVPKQFKSKEAMQDPTIRALFAKAKNRVGLEAKRAVDAKAAKLKVEKEVERLRVEAEQAKKDAEEAKKQVHIAAKESAEVARKKAARESSRLRELELGAKQAEMEEAVRQAEEEASRAQQANTALEQSKAEIAMLKEEMRRAIEHTQSEAKKSQLAIQQLAEEQVKKQQEQARRIAKEQERKIQEFERAKLLAEQEASQLKAETDAIREKYEQELRQKEEQFKLDSNNEIKRLQSEVLIKSQEEKIKAAQEAVLQAKRASIAESARMKAEADIENLKKHAEEQQEKLKQDSERQLEKARADAVKEASYINEEQQAQIESALRDAQELAKCVKQAEEARARAEQELERVSEEAEIARKHMQEQLESDIARSEVEHEVARARALELANKQEEIDEISRKAKEEASRAQRAEQARFEMEQEINRLKEDIERVRSEEVTKNQDENITTSEQFEGELQEARDEEVAKIRAEIESITVKAVQEATRAQAADDERRKSQEEIKRLKSEIELATQQAQAQLKADAEYAEAEQRELAKRTQEIERLQSQGELAVQNADLERARAKQAEEALAKIEKEVERIKNSEEANAIAQQELEQLRAEQTERKEREIENAKLKAQEESQRAQDAQREKVEAEKEIKRLNRVAKLQRKKAEQVIQKTIQTARKEIDQNMVKMRAAKRAERSIGKNIKKREPENQLVAAKKQPVRQLVVAKKEPVIKQKETKSHWISDQVLWETTLGIRIDEEASKIVAPDSPAKDDEPYISDVNVIAEDTESTKSHAIYSVRDVNPYVNTQDVSEIVEKVKNGGFEKYIIVFVGCCVLAFGAYYALMGKSSRSDLKQTVSETKTIKKIRNKVNEKLDVLSNSNKDSKSMSMEQRIQKKKARTDRIRLQQKNIGNEYRSTIQNERTSSRKTQKRNTRVSKSTVKNAQKKPLVKSTVVPVKTQQSIESIVNNNPSQIATDSPDTEKIELVVSVEQDAPQALQDGIPGAPNDFVIDEEPAFPQDQQGPKALQEAAASVVPSSISQSSEPEESSLPVIVESASQDTTDIKIDDNFNITVDQPALPKALQ